MAVAMKASTESIKYRRNIQDQPVTVATGCGRIPTPAMRAHSRRIQQVLLQPASRLEVDPKTGIIHAIKAKWLEVQGCISDEACYNEASV